MLLLHVFGHLVLDLSDVLVEVGNNLFTLPSLLSFDGVMLILERFVLLRVFSGDRLESCLHDFSFLVAILVLSGLPVEQLDLSLRVNSFLVDLAQHGHDSLRKQLVESICSLLV